MLSIGLCCMLLLLCLCMQQDRLAPSALPFPDAKVLIPDPFPVLKLFIMPLYLMAEKARLGY